MDLLIEQAPAAPVAVPYDPSLQALEAEICRGAANLTAAEHHWLGLVAEFDRRRGWAPWGCTSCAAWLSWQVGLDRRSAREKVRVAHALERFPLFGEAMATGALTYSKARAITRIATAEIAPELLALALAATSNQLERIVAGYRRSEPIEADVEAAAHASRVLHTSISRERGVMELTIRVPIESGCALLAAIDEHLDRADLRVPLSARRADAIVAMAEHSHAHAECNTSPGEPRYLVTLHLQPDGHLQPDEIEGSSAVERAQPGSCCVGAGDGTGDLYAVPFVTARRILCDAAMEAFTAGKGDQPLGLSRRQRRAHRRLRRAIRLRDGGCRFPGCERNGWVDLHHIIHWLDDGHTVEENLVCLCRFHHRLMHEGGWAIHGDPAGDLTFVDPNGRTVPSTPPQFVGSASAIDAHARSAKDGRCRWTGEAADLSLITSNLHHTRLLRLERQQGQQRHDTRGP